MAGSQFLGLRGKALTTAQTLLVVLPSFVLFGYNQSNLGGLVSLPDWTDHFPEIDTKHYTGAVKSQHATFQGVVIATFTLGAMVGCLSCSYTADKFGRRMVIFAAALLSLVGMVLECSSFQLAQLVVGRTILGAGVGMLSGTVPTWQSECCDPKHRGRHVVLDGLFISLGYMLQAWINLGFYQFKTGPVTWRPAVAIPIFFALVLLGSIFLMPESPRWLVRQGRHTEAEDTIAALKGAENAANALAVKAELVAIDRALEIMSTQNTSLSSLVSMGEDRLLYRFGLCILLQFYQQMSGGNLISVYSTVIFEQGLGLSSETARILSGGTLTWKFLSCFVSFFAIDRFGRRASLMVSGTGMASCMLGLAVATSFPKSVFGAQVASTMGLRLEDIDLIFHESPSVMKTVAYARNRVSFTDEEVLEKDKHEHKEVA
ncbi:hypothetical protein SLS63_003742 [Diaporthe eres]|uniref:Major facilitator superfamily (MFS) profile domain-containing protein n=1 Tax=Diaporthe eres TaxID=83184 RepID=A0ABR1PGA6_DIAER